MASLRRSLRRCRVMEPPFPLGMVKLLYDILLPMKPEEEGCYPFPYGRSRCAMTCSPSWIGAEPPRFRFRLAALWLSRCRFPAFFRVTLPEPVILKRLSAPLCVFIMLFTFRFIQCSFTSFALPLPHVLWPLWEPGS